MSKISIVELVFENCIILELPISAFISLNIEKIGSDFCTANAAWSMKEKFHAYGGISFILSSNINQFRWTNTLNGKEIDGAPHTQEAIARRLQSNDIANIDLNFEDGRHQYISVPYIERNWHIDDDANLLQSTSVDAGGQITVVIRPAKNND